MVELSTRQKLTLLSSLYFSQGLPYGFFTQAVPYIMRQEGVDLSVISGVTSALALPWAMKFFWAPLVDRYQGSPLGPRRGFIVPLQLVSVLLVLLMAALRGQGSVVVVLAGAVALTNLLAASQDIATDALAVKLLDQPHERGLGNGVQVAGYRLGMIVGGGALVASFAVLGWVATFVMMAVMLLVSSIPILLYREPRLIDEPRQVPSVAGAIPRYLRRRGVWLWLLLLAAYKIGDGYGSPMVRMFLQDEGMSMTRIGFLTGVLGSVVALGGALFGGWLSARGRLRALVWAGVLHGLLMAGYATGAHAMVTMLLVLEHFTGSMATVALFACMMDATRSDSAGVEYTVQASVVVIASGIGNAVSGWSVEQVGYPLHFLIAGVLCVLGSVLMIPAYGRWRMPPRTDDDHQQPSGLGGESSAAIPAVST
jgi:MFS transporter, PAT family, beta-lactamase induction signal transducer AmpG